MFSDGVTDEGLTQLSLVPLVINLISKNLCDHHTLATKTWYTLIPTTLQYHQTFITIPKNRLSRMMLINQSAYFYISHSTDKTNINNNKQGKLSMISFQPVNEFMSKNKMTHPAPLIQPSSIICSKQIHISS